MALGTRGVASPEYSSSSVFSQGLLTTVVTKNALNAALGSFLQGL
jgi:hypothetical protein